METANLELPVADAHRMFLKYKSHMHNQGRPTNPIDVEVMRIYRAIASGKVIVRALESIRKAGLGRDGLPKMAIVRADAKRCHLTLWRDGSARMSALTQINRNSSSTQFFNFDVDAFPRGPGYFDRTAIVPHVPPDIRPKRGLQNYHILFEAVWRPEPPVDPMLLRRIGKGDMWLVVGAWELTEVERAVMADRIDLRRR